MSRRERDRRLAHALALAAGGLAVISTSAASGGDVFTDTFTDGSNVGQWAYGANDSIMSTGGNPGFFLHSSELDTFAPMPGTPPGHVSPFSGNYRARGVTRMGVDLNLFHVDFSAQERPLTLILVHDNDTPSDFNDDYGVFNMGPNIPLEGEGWKHYEFDVPSHEVGIPDGWRRIQFGENSPPVIWNRVIEDVDRVIFFYGDPRMFFIFQMWEVGLDNAFIETDPAGDAALTGFEITRGTLISGGLSDMAQSDDQSLRYRSGFGSTLTDLHSADMTIDAETDETAPATLDLTVEARLSHAGGGTARLRLFNFDTQQLDQVGQFALGATDTVSTVADIAAGPYVDDDGAIRLTLRTVVVVPVFAFTYDTLVDQVRIAVE